MFTHYGAEVTLSNEFPLAFHQSADVAHQVNSDSLLVATKLNRIVEHTRNGVALYYDRYAEVEFDHLLEECDEVERFLLSGCLDFGLEIMNPIVSLVLIKFIVAVETIADKFELIGDQVAKKLFDKSILFCKDIMESCQSKPH